MIQLGISIIRSISLFVFPCIAAAFAARREWNWVILFSLFTMTSCAEEIVEAIKKR